MQKSWRAVTEVDQAGIANSGAGAADIGGARLDVDVTDQRDFKNVVAGLEREAGFAGFSRDQDFRGRGRVHEGFARMAASISRAAVATHSPTMFG